LRVTGFGFLVVDKKDMKLSKQEKSASNNINTEAKKSFKDNVLWFISIVGFVILVIGTVEFRVNQKINDPEFLLELSAKVRPALIFDANETVHADMGARELIEPIKVVKKGERNDDLQITITPKKHLAYPPLIESMNLFDFTQEVKRGKDNQWIYDLIQTGCTDCEKTPRFRLEILKTH